MHNGIKIIRIGQHQAPYEYYSEHNGISGIRTNVTYAIGCDHCGKSLRIADRVTGDPDGDFEKKIWETRIDFSRVFCPSQNWKWQADGW